MIKANDLSDSDKLRLLADWHDKYDDNREYSGDREVQGDLRRIADAIENGYCLP